MFTLLSAKRQKCILSVVVAPALCCAAAASAGPIVKNHGNANVRVTVIDAVTGEPAEALVGIFGEAESRTAVTDETGNALYEHLAEGVYQVQASPLFGGTSRFKRIVVPTEGEIQVQFTEATPEGPVVSYDQEGDGLPGVDEIDKYGTDPKLVDTDGDGLPDGFEVLFSLGPLDPLSAEADADSDGASNLEEFQAGTNPRVFDGVGAKRAKGILLSTLAVKVIDGRNTKAVDGIKVALNPGAADGNTDFQGLYTVILPTGQYGLNVGPDNIDPARWSEVAENLDLKKTIESCLVTLPPLILINDNDGDGIPNNEETETDPNNPDTDGDGIPDDVEIGYGTDPLTPNPPSDNPFDVNIDGSVNAVDLQTVVNRVLQLPISGNADINHSGTFDAIDVQLMVSALLD